MDLLLLTAYGCVVVLEKSTSTWRSHRVGASCAEATRDERMAVLAAGRRRRARHCQ